MPIESIQLKPGVDAQLTQAANMAGVFDSQLIRYKESLIQSYGGWVNYIPTTIPSTIRDLHAWQGLNSNKYLAVAATQNLDIITNGSAITDITPQTRTSNPAPSFSIALGSCLVTIVDGGSSVSVFDTVYFNTPVALGGAGGYLLNGAYQISGVLGSSVYTIALSNVSTFTLSSGGTLPVFSIIAGAAIIDVNLSNNNFLSIPGLFQQFIAPTQVGSTSDGILVQGIYQVKTIIDSTHFQMTNTTQASTTASATMNGGLAQLMYYVSLGPQPLGSGFGGGGFGLGGFGSGATITGAPGTPITATDWTLDNWGEILLACPKNGGIYTWAADSGLVTAQVISNAPIFNGGIFVSMPQQILVAWASTESSGVQDSLIVRWCNAGDFTNWLVSNTTTAGSFHIPTGSFISGGMQGPNFALISTDIDVWIMQYVGGTVIFNFTRVGSGCGWVGPHAAGILGGAFYWCGTNNFFTLSQGGVIPIPCTVWDKIFQNLNAANQSKVRCAVNSTFNEITWFYPSSLATENDRYVKVHIEGSEYEWDFGTLSRTAWTDISVLGPPIGCDTSGTIYQHEIGNVISGVGLPSFQTGWWAISESMDVAFVDQIIPDFIWGTQSGSKDALVALTFFSAEYPGSPTYSYGPYTVGQTTPYVNVRIRGRLMSMLVQSVNSEFWRIGRIRYRVAKSGRRQ